VEKPEFDGYAVVADKINKLGEQVKAIWAISVKKIARYAECRGALA
jgi:hypothetical protein